MTLEESYNEALREWGLRFLGGVIEPAPPLPEGVDCPCINCTDKRKEAKHD
jgi:hypothetical protein